MIKILSDTEIDAVLRHNCLGRIGFTDGNRCYIIPVNYVYDGISIIAHSVAGMKTSIMQANPSVCFEVDEVSTSQKWKSVLAWGIYQELRDERNRSHAIQLFSTKGIHLKVIEAGTNERPQINSRLMSQRPIIYRIVTTERSGRYEDG